MKLKICRACITRANQALKTENGANVIDSGPKRQ